MSALSGITCPTAAACVSVGSDANFNGKSAVINAATGTGIAGIACPSASLCLMGEHDISGEVIQLLNNGTFGTSHTLPAGTSVQAISCYKASLCYALGASSSGAIVDKVKS